MQLRDELDTLTGIDGGVVPTRCCVVALERRGDRGCHTCAEGRVDLACSWGGREGGDGGGEELEGLRGDLAAAELGEELLLSREVEVLVRDDGVLRDASDVESVPRLKGQEKTIVARERTQIVPM